MYWVKRYRVEVSTFCLNPEQADMITRLMCNYISGHNVNYNTKKDILVEAEASSANSE